MDNPDWLDNFELSLQPNSHLSLIRKVIDFDDLEFRKQIHKLISYNHLSDGEKKIVEKLETEGELSKISILIDAMKSKCSLEKITSFLKWNDFESLTGEILHLAGWDAYTNFRYFGEGGQTKDRRRFEIDILAWKKPFVLLIDNKRHKKTSPSYLKDTVLKQQNRAYELFDMIPIIHDLPEMGWVKKWDTAIIFPLILTWRNQGIVDIQSTPIIPSNHLINVLSNFRVYFDEKNWFNLKWERIV